MTVTQIIESVSIEKVAAHYAGYHVGGSELVSVKPVENIFYEKRSVLIHLRQIAASDGRKPVETSIKMGASKFRKMFS